MIKVRYFKTIMTDNDNSNLDIDIDRNHIYVKNCAHKYWLLCALSLSYHTQIHPCVHKIKIRQDTGRCTSKNWEREMCSGCFASTKLLLLALSLQLLYSHKSLNFYILVPETNTRPGPLVTGHPGPNTTPVGCLFCFSASQTGNSV